LCLLNCSASVARLTPQAAPTDAITASQRAAAAAVLEWEICAAEVTETLNAESRRRRRAMKRAYVNAMRSGKWLLTKAPTAATMKPDVATPAAGASVEASSG
jgi:hypothetical protein